jgi:hypothetical protein
MIDVTTALFRAHAPVAVAKFAGEKKIRNPARERSSRAGSIENASLLQT